MKTAIKLIALIVFTLCINTVSKSQPYPWPLKPQNEVHRIWNGYGQYQNVQGEYFHEGIDLIGAIGTPVLAVKTGLIVEKYTDPAQDRSLKLGLNDSLSSIDSVDRAFWYLHINIGNNPRRAGTSWVRGDTANLGDTLGYILQYGDPGFLLLPHMHFEYDNKKNPNSWLSGNPSPGSGYSGIADPNGNPITVLTPRTDSVPPVFENRIYFRKGLMEGNNTAPYATAYHISETGYSRKVVKEEVDMIINASETFGSFSLNFLLPVIKIKHKLDTIPGHGGGSYAYKQLVDFSGRFLENDQPDTTRNSYKKFRPQAAAGAQSLPFVHVIYENDASTVALLGSVFDSSTSDRRYYYILTNIDTAHPNSIQKTDSAYYWDTKVRDYPGARWNNKYMDATHRADSNNTALFPDGLYAVSVQAEGYGGAADTSNMNDTVFVNNFNEYIYSCDSTGAERDTFTIGSKVYINGKGFPKNRSFRVFVSKDTAWVDATWIRGGAAYLATTITVTSNSNGIIPTTLLWSEYVPNGTPDKGYQILLDYDKDSVYTSPRAGNTVDVRDASINNSKSIIGNIIVNKTIKHVTCSDSCNGKIIYSVKAGLKPPYHFYIDSCQCLDDSVITDLCAGTYKISIVDSIGVTVHDSVVITAPPPIINHPTISLTQCAGQCNGRIFNSPTGGYPPYSYSWTGPGGSPPDSFRIDLCPATYIVTITDSLGCVLKDTNTVHDVPPLIATCSSDSVGCSDSTGYAGVDVSGGHYPYLFNFQWSNGATTQEIFQLPAGAYTVTVTDPHGQCTTSCSVNVYARPFLNAAAITTSVTCPNPNSGAINLTVSGGVQPYQYQWSGPNNFTATTKNISNLIAGIYTVTVTDSRSCKKTSTVQVQGTPPININAFVYNPPCPAQGVGSGIGISPTGGVGSLTALWNTGSTSNNLAGLAPGTYTVTVTDGNTCFKDTIIIVTGADTIRVNATVQQPNCNISTGAIYLTISGGKMPYFVNWSHGPTSNNIINLSPGTYTVTVTDSNGCSVIKSYIINSFTSTLSAVTSSTADYCFNGNGSAIVSVSGGNPPYDYEWSNGQTSQALNYLSGGTYTVTVTDSIGCSTTALANVNSVNITINLNANVTQPACSTGESITINPTGGSGNYDVYWSNGAYNTYSINNLSDGVYFVYVYDNIFGCSASQVFSLTAPACNVSLNLKLYIEGYYLAGGVMQPVLLNSNYGFNYNDADYIYVELHYSYYPYYLAYSSYAMLYTNGLANLTYPSSVSGGSYYIVVKHRNAIETWSKYPVTMGSFTYYDFSSSP